jgi:hypothetical protein
MRTRRGRDPVAHHVLASGLLRCSCGATMLSITKPTKTPGVLYERYVCRTRIETGPEACGQAPIPREPVDRAVWEFFTQTALDVDATRATIGEQQRRSSPSSTPS